jgi:hypothetical protein
MQIRIHYAVVAALVLLPGTVAAQSANPVADAFRDNYKEEAKNLMAAADEFPADIVPFVNSGHGLFYDERDKFNEEVSNFMG